MKPTVYTLLTAAIASVLAPCVFGAPLLNLQEKEFDFGFAPQNSKITHVFWLKNTGDELLKIEKVVPGCGCTQAPLDKEELTVGDSTRLEVIFSTRRYNQHTTKRPRIVTNEGPPDKTVTIMADCVQRPDSTFPVVVKPYKLDISQFGERVLDSMQFTITNVSEEDVKLNLVAGLPEHANITLPDEIKAGQTGHGRVVLNAEVLDTEFEKSFTFEVGDTKKVRFTVPIKRSIKSPGGDEGSQAEAGH